MISRVARAPGHPVINYASYDFQVVLIREFRKRRRRQCLVPVSDRSDIVLLRQIATAAAPAESLDCHAQILFEADRIHDMPAVKSEARLRVIQTVRTDHLA